MKNLKEMNVSEQIKYWQARGYWPVVKRKEDSCFCVVSTNKSNCAGNVRISYWQDSLEEAKDNVGKDSASVRYFDHFSSEIVDVLHPSELTGNEKLEVGTEVIVIDDEGVDLKNGDVVTIIKVYGARDPYLVKRDDGQRDWFAQHQIKPYFKKESDEIQKAIEVLTKAGKIQDGKIINLN